MPYLIAKPAGKKEAHHESINALWEFKWKKRADAGVYPFMEGKLEDFEGIFEKLAKKKLRPPYDFEAYAEPFIPVGDKLNMQAAVEESIGNLQKAQELYFRAACVYRIGRFPYPQTPTQVLSWMRQKEAFLKGARLLEEPIVQYDIPFKHGKKGTSEEKTTIPVFVRKPRGDALRGFPTILQIYGLDGYRTDCLRLSTDHVRYGCVTVAIEIPGTGDSPALASDPEGPDRLYGTVLEWLREQPWANRDRIISWGVSTGAYYALRLAHTHKEYLAATICQGVGCHYMFDPEWLDVTCNLDYPFDLAHFLALKFGYGSVNEMKKDSQEKFSLLTNGILDKPSGKVFLVNGVDDDIFPIEDSFLALQHGSVKEARFMPGLKHMGEPVAGRIIMDWLHTFLDELK